MTKSLYHIIFTSFMLLIFGTTAFCQDVTLTWDPSPTPDVTGYKVYYKENNSTLPFDGVGANEGPSPVDVGDNLTATLTGLPDDTIYYFSVTAYDSAGYESSFSNLVSNSWMPELLAPENYATREPVPATFQWSTEPTGLPINYTLFYGTDENLVTTAGTFILADPANSPPTKHLMVLLCVALLIIIAMNFPINRKLKFATGVLTAGLILTSCGGGGGGGGDTSSTRSSTDTASPAAAVYTIDKGSSDYHQAYDLQPETTYFWKVVATDTSNPTMVYSSTVASFTTDSF